MLHDSQDPRWSLTDQLPVGVYRTTVAGKFLYANPALAQLLECDSVDDLIAHSAVDFHFSPEARENQLQEWSATREVMRSELQFRTKTGKLIWVRDTRRIIFTAAGEIAYFDGVVEDITEQKRAQGAEQEQRQLAEALRDTASALNSILDTDQLLQAILEQAARVVPNDTANIILIEDGIAHVVRTRGYAERGMEDRLANISYVVANTPNMRWMVETGRPMAIENVDEYPFWVHNETTSWIKSYVGVPIRLDSEVIGFLNLDSATPHTFTLDDAERLQVFADQAALAIRNARLYSDVRQHNEVLEQRVRERTAALESERAQLRAILDSISEGVVFNHEFSDFYINRALCDMTGYPADALKTYADLAKLLASDLSPEEMERAAHPVYNIVVRQGFLQRERVFRRRDGSEFEVLITDTRVTAPDGAALGVVSVIRDITQDKELQRQKERFLAYASHELRTPITNLKTRLYLLRKQPQRLVDHLKILDGIADWMHELVSDLLDISHLERGILALERRVVALQPLIDNVMRMQQPEADARQIDLQVEMPPALLYIYADPARIVQVITNLVVNAIRYTQPGGRVCISLRVEADLHPQAVICVDDTGVGIAPEHLQQIFQPFFRVSHESEGSGLGLSITRHIVELHDGEITVESEPGRGTTFCVWLALVDEPARVS